MAISDVARRAAERRDAAEVRRAHAEQQLMSADIELSKFVLDVVAKGVPDLDLSESLLTGEVVRTVEGASQLTVTVHDASREVLKSGILGDKNGKLRAVDVKLDGLWFRLVKVNKAETDLLLTFEDRDVSWLRAKKGPRKAASRAKVTRAQYVLSLVRSVKARRIPVNIPGLAKKRPVGGKATSPKTKTVERDQQRRKGFGEGESIEGVTKSQLANIAVFMREAEEQDATTRPILAGLVAGFGESGWNKAARNGIHQGVFQSAQIPGEDLEAQSKHFLIGGRSFRAGGAIKAARDNPNWTVGKIASYVEISDASGSHYDKHRGVANRVLQAWGGADSSETGRTYTKRYTFRVEPKETYWDAIQRLAEEVNWRAFMSAGTFHYISEEELYKSRHRYRFNEDTPGVLGIDFDWDHRKKLGKATVVCRIDRWGAPPGTVVVVDDLGPASGRWLVETIRRNLFTADAEITLKKPMEERPEPAAETVTTAGTGSTEGASGGEVYDEAKKASDATPGYLYGGGHGPPLSSLKYSQRLDCSASSSLVLKNAGKFNGETAQVSGWYAANYGKPGRGKTFTVWANAGHMFIQSEGGKKWRFDTGGPGGGKGPKLHHDNRPTSGFTPRHWPGS